MVSRLWSLSLISVVILLSCLSCARISVYKINTDTSGKETVDKTVSGIRYYRPRPYVSVHEPFPIAATTHIARGRMTADGKYLILEKVPDSLKAQVAVVDGEARVEATRVMVPGAPRGSVVAEGETEPGKQPAQPSEPTEKKPTSGVTVTRSTNDPNAYSIIAGRRYFDIVFLPDFDENYVVDVKPGLGNSQSLVGLGQGWSLQSLDASTDNSQITEPLLALFGDSMKTLTELGKRAVGIPPIPGGPAAQGEVGTAATELNGGQEVSIRLTQVRVVAPGLYPILKPAEQQKLELAKKSDSAATTKDDRFKQVHVPLVYATNIAFNVYETVLIEAIPATGDSTYRLLQYGGTAPAGPIEGGGSGSQQRREMTPAQLEKLLRDQVKDSQGKPIELRVVLDPAGGLIVEVPTGVNLSDSQKAAIEKLIKDNSKAGTTVTFRPA